MKRLDLGGYLSTFPANDAEEGFIELTPEQEQVVGRELIKGGLVSSDLKKVLPMPSATSTKKQKDDYWAAQKKIAAALEEHPYILGKSREAEQTFTALMKAADKQAKEREKAKAAEDKGLQKLLAEEQKRQEEA